MAFCYAKFYPVKKICFLFEITILNGDSIVARIDQVKKKKQQQQSKVSVIASISKHRRKNFIFTQTALP